MDESKNKSKPKPNNYEIIYKIIEDNGEAMTLDEIVDTFREVNPKSENYNYKAAVRSALKNKIGIAEVRSDTYDISRRLYDGRSFRVKPIDEALDNGLPVTLIPECGCLALSLQTEKKKDATVICDTKSKRYYRLDLYKSPGPLFEPRLQGLDIWLEDVGFKHGDEFILTCVDIEDRRFEIEHCPAAKRKKTLTKAVDKELADLAYELMKEGLLEAEFGSHFGFIPKDILNALLIAGGYKGDVVPSVIDDILAKDHRLIVKDINHVFIKTDYERIYPDDDFESIEARFKKRMSDFFDSLGDGELDELSEAARFEKFQEFFEDDNDATRDNDHGGEDDLAAYDNDEAFDELVELASCVAMAKNQKEAVKEWAAGESKEFVRTTAEMVEQMWNEVPRPELGFKTINEFNRKPGLDIGAAGNGSVIAVDFEKGEKVGRNDPCPCGSGKKYKKCCQGKIQDDSKEDLGSDLEKVLINLAVVECMVSDMYDHELEAIDLDICRPCHRFLVACQYRERGNSPKAVDILLALAKPKGEDPALEYSFVYEELANCAVDLRDLDNALGWMNHAIAYDKKHEDGIREDDLRPKFDQIRKMKKGTGNVTTCAPAGISPPAPTAEFNPGINGLPGVPGVPIDKRAMEKTMSDLGRLMNEQNFESIDEANAFLEELTASGEIDNIGNIGGKSALSSHDMSPQDEAQELMYSAWEARGRRRIKLACDALKVSPDCADAYVLLAEETAKDLREAKALYEKGVKAGERALGPKAFKDDTGYFWGLIETRPYMRALNGLSECLWLLGERDRAIEYFAEMLRLNPNDNQGIRYQLAMHFLEDGRDADCEKLLDQYKGDSSAYWMYNYALLMYRKSKAIENGNSKKPQDARGTQKEPRSMTGAPDKTKQKAKASLKEAVKRNPHVPEYLLGKKRLPKEPPELIGFGDENEAIAYAYDAAAVWRATDGAIKWIRDNCR